MAGPNALLDKGFYVDPTATAAGVAFGLCCKYSASSQGDMAVLGDTVTTPAAGTDFVVGVFQETLDAAKITTGKAAASVRLMGISRCQSDGSGTIAVGNKLILAGSNGQLKAASASVGNQQVVGWAMSPAAATAGAFLDVMLTPGATLNTAVS